MYTGKQKIDNSKKEIERKESFFWINNTTKCARIDKNLSEKGSTTFQVKDTYNNERTCAKGNELPTTKDNLFSKFYKRMDSVLSKSSASGGKSENRVKATTTKNRHHHHSVVEMEIDNSQQVKKESNNTRSIKIHERIIALPPSSPPQISNGKNELNDWKITLLNELDATQYGFNNSKSPDNNSYNQEQCQLYDSTDCNKLVINTLRPSGMENNRAADQHFSIAMDEKLDVILKKTMIDDWLHFNIIPNLAVDLPSSYLQQYQSDQDNNNNELFSKKQLSNPNDEGLSLLSAQLKNQGKKKRDHIKEKLDIAAARRNEIKYNRLRERMDTALFETMHMLRENGDNRI